MSMPSQPCFLSHFAALRDPRQATKVLYPLPEILLLMLCGTIAGADDFVEISLWGSERQGFLRRFLPFKHGIPSHDTLCDVIAAIDPELFKTCFLTWVDGLRTDTPEIIAIDGKTSRRSHARGKGRLPLHTVSAWATRQRLVLGQEAVSAKSNEITAIPVLLRRLELAGALVTIDAMGTQKEIAQTIIEGGGDYVLALKENWPATYAEVETVFADPPPTLTLQSFETVDGDHGRIETRRHTICHDIDWLFAERRHPGEFAFPGLTAIGMIESETERGGVIQTETRYYLCSTKLSAETLARVVRSHWGIENRLHWVLDVVFHDDLARLRTAHGPANMAVVKHTAMNLLNQAKPVTSFKNRRKKAGWNQDYLENVIRRIA
ncbi:ISAs1 family transposase [Rhodopila sp.]|uniref:ISAs1 family transposase n=2 Tax=Rhodopila sp. TaxID=2480087 RepID=UPI003D103CE7